MNECKNPESEQEQSSVYQVVVHSAVQSMVTTTKTSIFQEILSKHYLDRRTSVDRLRQASIASSSSDLANSMSPPAVRFNMETVVLTPNALGITPLAHKRSPPSSSPRTMQHSSSPSNLGHHQNSKLLFDTSPMKSRQKPMDFDSKRIFSIVRSLGLIGFSRFTGYLFRSR